MRLHILNKVTTVTSSPNKYVTSPTFPAKGRYENMIDHRSGNKRRHSSSVLYLSFAAQTDQPSSCLNHTSLESYIRKAKNSYTVMSYTGMYVTHSITSYPRDFGHVNTKLVTWTSGKKRNLAISSWAGCLAKP